MESLLGKIREAGIVGAGGAGFPTHVKLKGDIDTVIINNAECEPLLQVDKNLAKHFADQMAQGLNHIMTMMNIKRGVIGIKDKYDEVIRILEASCANYSGLEVYPLPNIYPIGDEVVLIEEVTGKVIKKGGLPIQEKIVVMNTETLLNIYNKVFEDKNVTHTYVTLTGEVENPGTYRLPIGMRIGEIMETLAKPKLKQFNIIIGGPMTGTLADPSDVVRKNTKALIVLDSNHTLVRRSEDANINHLTRIMASCSQCRLCTDLCPRNLIGHQVEPHKLMNAMANGLKGSDRASVLNTALGCVNCGVCELYACHHDLSPRKMMVMVKQEFAKNGVRPSGEGCVPMHADRDYRRVPSGRLVLHLGLKKYDKPYGFYDAGIVPKSISVPLNQHIGKPAAPCVVVGDSVACNQLIAEGATDALSANIHCGIDGIVKQITKDSIIIERI